MTVDHDYFPALLGRMPGLPGPEAAALLEGATEAHPGDPRPWLLLGGLHAEANAWDWAEAAYSMALLRDPGFAIARFQLGLLQATSGRPASALATWAPLDGLAEGHPLRLFKQAFACLIRSDFDQAILFIERGIANNPGNPPLNKDMQGVLDRTRQVLRDRADAAATTEAGEMSEEAVRPEIPIQFLLSAYKQVQ